MHKLLSIVLFGVITSSCSSQLNCEDFKTGSFKYPNASGLDLIIERTTNKQIEKSNKKNSEDIYLIKWSSACSYELILQESNQKTEFMVPLKDTMFVNIISIKENKYSFKATLNNKLYKGELIKTKS